MCTHGLTWVGEVGDVWWWVGRWMGWVVVEMGGRVRWVRGWFVGWKLKRH